MMNLAAIMIAALSVLMQPTGVADIPNGKAAPFVGRWAVDMPDGESELDEEGYEITCSGPVKIERLTPEKIAYVSPEGAQTNYALMAFGGRTSMVPAEGPTAVAVWLGADRFDLYRVGDDGSVDWNAPHEFSRCANAL